MKPRIILSTLLLATALLCGCNKPANEPDKSALPVLKYRITHYLPGGEVRVYNTDANYTTTRSTVWFKYYQDGQSYRRTLAGSWLIEELP